MSRKKNYSFDKLSIFDLKRRGKFSSREGKVTPPLCGMDKLDNILGFFLGSMLIMFIDIIIYCRLKFLQCLLKVVYEWFQVFPPQYKTICMDKKMSEG